MMTNNNRERVNGKEIIRDAAIVGERKNFIAQWIENFGGNPQFPQGTRDQERRERRARGPLRRRANKGVCRMHSLRRGKKNALPRGSVEGEKNKGGRGGRGKGDSCRIDWNPFCIVTKGKGDAVDGKERASLIRPNNTVDRRKKS